MQHLRADFRTQLHSMFEEGPREEGTLATISSQSWVHEYGATLRSHDSSNVSFVDGDQPPCSSNSPEGSALSDAATRAAGSGASTLSRSQWHSSPSTVSFQVSSNGVNPDPP